MLDRVDQMTHSLAGYGPTPGSSLTTALSLSLILVRLLRLMLTWTRLGHVAMTDRPDTSVAFLFSQVQSESVTFRDVFPPCVVSANQAALPSRHEAARAQSDMHWLRSLLPGHFHVQPVGREQPCGPA